STRLKNTSKKLLLPEAWPSPSKEVGPMAFLAPAVRAQAKQTLDMTDSRSMNLRGRCVASSTRACWSAVSGPLLSQEGGLADALEGRLSPWSLEPALGRWYSTAVIEPEGWAVASDLGAGGRSNLVRLVDAAR